MTPLPERIARREFLARNTLGLGALAFGDLVRRDADGGDRRRRDLAPRAKRVIWLFMAGAPSQFELFEPKPTLQRLHGQTLPPSLSQGKRFAFIDGADAKLLGTERRFARHGQCGAWMSELLPHTAGIVDDLCFLRAVRATQINHGPAKLFMNTGFGQFGRPSAGAWVLYGLGSEADDLPGFVVLQSGSRGPRGGAPLWGNGFLSTRLAGTPFRAQGDPVLDLQTPAGVDPTEQADFFSTLGAMNELAAGTHHDPETEARIAAYELAFRMQASTPELVDLRREPQSMRRLYGVADDRPSFARNCLLARRLIERGCRFVQLYHADWDHHGDPSNHIGAPLDARCREVDRASAALVLDLKQRGLLDDTLVIWSGEFGRTPMGEVRQFLGRDHHIEAFTLWMAGGGVRAGHSHGETDEIGFGPVQGEVEIHDLHATMLHLLGFDHTKLTYRFQGRDHRLTDVHGRVIRDILA
ncbi:MAG: DUF1501 domain-containing protein [Planctomycetota bacterium]